MDKVQTSGRFPQLPHHTQKPEIIWQEESEFHQIEICSHPVFGNQLWIDGDLQNSASDNAYNVAMVSPLLSHGNLENVCIMGGGDGGVLTELLRCKELLDLPIKQAVMVDIDKQVIKLAGEYLPEFNGDVFSHPNTNLIIGDAFGYLDKTDNLDAVIYDLTMDPIRENDDRETWVQQVLNTISQRLQPGGMLSMQVCGERENDPMLDLSRTEYLNLVTREVDKHFAGYVLQNVFIPSFGEAWTFLTAQKPVS